MTPPQSPAQAAEPIPWPRGNVTLLAAILEYKRRRRRHTTPEATE